MYREYGKKGCKKNSRVPLLTILVVGCVSLVVYNSSVPVSVIHPFQGNIFIIKGKVKKFGDLQLIRANVDEKTLVIDMKLKVS